MLMNVKTSINVGILNSYEQKKISYLAELSRKTVFNLGARFLYIFVSLLADIHLAVEESVDCLVYHVLVRMCLYLFPNILYFCILCLSSV